MYVLAVWTKISRYTTRIYKYLKFQVRMLEVTSKFLKFQIRSWKFK